MRRAFRLTAAVAFVALAAGPAAQTPPEVADVLVRVGERIAQYYKRAQNVICIEKSTMQPISWNFSPEGFARVTEAELHIEADPGDGNGPGEARVVREVRKINGRAPRERDKKDRSGCTDPNPLSPEPLSFLLQSHRSEYRFASAGFGKGKDRNTMIIEFTFIGADRKPQLIEDPGGHEDCYDWSGPLPAKGRVWVDANTYDVVRVERRTLGPLDVRVPAALQRRRNFGNSVVVEREDLTIRYRTVAFTDPDEAMLLPESIDELIVVHGGLQSTRRNQKYSDYRRFVTGARLVK